MRRVLAVSVIHALCAVCCVHWVAGAAQADETFTPGGAPDLRAYKVVFTTQDRDADGHSQGFQDMYTVNGDGSNLTLVQPLGPGVFYDWPSWAYNGTRLVFTARSSIDPGGVEQVYMSRPDGSDLQQLTFNTWRNLQPRISPDGRSLLFNSAWSEFPEVGIYRQQLDTGLVEPLSARDAASYNDADPRWIGDGSRILFATLGRDPNPERPTHVYTMNADGTDRQLVTNDSWFDTDPTMSPDGRYIAMASYRGVGYPVSNAARDGHLSLQDTEKAVAVDNWQLIVRDVNTGSETSLTQGQDCLHRVSTELCKANEGSAWVPVWLDSQHLAYLSGRNALGMGIYVVDRDGSNARPVVQAQGKTISWQDWTLANQPAPAADLLTSIRTTPPDPSMVYVAPVFGELAPGASAPSPGLFVATGDRWLSTQLTPVLGDGTPLTPEVARLSADRRSVFFSARFPDDAMPPIPPDQDLQDAEPNPDDGLPGQRQVFAMPVTGGAVRQLTWPDTQDLAEPIPDGEPRSNFDPDVSPDGRYVVFSNYSQALKQTWILRLDLQTGELVNLSMVNRGIVPGADAHARFSPDGQRIAFVGTVGFNAQILTMGLDGSDIQQITNDSLMHAYPAWSPDGRDLVFTEMFAGDASAGSAQPASNWGLVREDLASGRQTSLVGGQLPMLWPVWSPTGDRIAYVTYGLYEQPDIFVVGSDGSDPHPMMTTVRSRETYVDWR